MSLRRFLCSEAAAAGALRGRAGRGRGRLVLCIRGSSRAARRAAEEDVVGSGAEISLSFSGRAGAQAEESEIGRRFRVVASQKLCE